MNKPIIVAVTILLGGFYGCQNDDKPAEEAISIEKKIDSLEELPHSSSSNRNLHLVMNDIPSPIEVATILSESKAPFRPDLMNPVENADYYETTFQKAFNLGIYAADLNYAIVYDQHKEVLKHLFVMKYMADEVEISEAVDEHLLHRIELNIKNRDSLINLTLPIYKALDNFLNKNKKENIAAMALSGAWLEGTYIATKVVGEVKRSESNELIYHKLTQQGLALENIIEVLSRFEQSSDKLSEVLLKFKDIQQSFQVKDSDPIMLDQLQEIAKKVDVLRNELTRI